jgi:hypothetical protein
MKIILLTSLILLFNIQSNAQDEKENWKSFQCKENHFSIKFPDYCTEIITRGPISESWKETIKEKGPLRFSFDVLKYSVTFGNDVVPIYCLTIYHNPENIGLQDFIYKIIVDNMDTYHESEITLKSHDFEGFDSYIAQYENKEGGYSGIKSELFIQRENEIYRLVLYTDVNDKYDQLFNKIIETIMIEE